MPTTQRQLWQLPPIRLLRITLATLALLATPVAAQRTPAAEPTPYARAIAAGYKAAMYCSGIFTAGRTPARIDADELTGIYPDYGAIVPTLLADIDRRAKAVTVVYDAAMPPRRSEWRPGRGCTTLPPGMRSLSADPVAPRVIAPHRPHPAQWPQGDVGIRPAPSPALAAVTAAAFAGRYGVNTKTTGVVILRDGRIVAERYAAGWGPDTPNRTWSVAKSIAGTLVGLAVMAQAADVAAPAAIPAWQWPGDPRAGITLDRLLRMASGLHSDTAGNRTDGIYFGGTAVDEQAAGWPLATPPGARFRYANNDSLLALLSLRTTLGEERYAWWPHDALLGPLGMAHTTPERDWRGNYILSSQVWSTARDLARLGQFWLQDGVWQDKRLLPEGWIRYMTSPTGPQPADGPGYGATLWLFGPKQGLPDGSYAAQGNRGQFVMVVPSARLVVVRRGEDPGAARFDIAKFVADVLAAQ